MKTKKVPMSASEHEPGPWILGGASGRMITTPSGYYGDGFIADVDTLANARLIAAAPDLLDALRDALNAIDSAANTNPSAFGWIEAKARFAIAKAEGR